MRTFKWAPPKLLQQVQTKDAVSREDHSKQSKHRAKGPGPDPEPGPETGRIPKPTPRSRAPGPCPGPGSSREAARPSQSGPIAAGAEMCPRCIRSI